MTTLDPLRGFRITDKETHGLLNPWKNLVDNGVLGEAFHDCPLEAQLEGALHLVCLVKSLDWYHWVWHEVVDHTNWY